MTGDVITVHWVSLTAGWGFFAGYEGCFSRTEICKVNKTADYRVSEPQYVRTVSGRALFSRGRGGSGGGGRCGKNFAFHSGSTRAKY
jgi:hypothetical protein